MGCSFSVMKKGDIHRLMVDSEMADGDTHFYDDTGALDDLSIINLPIAFASIWLLLFGDAKG